MITLKSPREIEEMREAGHFLADIHKGLRTLIAPGLDMWEIERYVRRRCLEDNFLPLQIGVPGDRMRYPYATCVSLNDEVAHAFPRHYKLKDGDLLKVDMVLGRVDRALLDVSALDFDNVEAMAQLTQAEDAQGQPQELLYSGLADSCWAYAVGDAPQEVLDLMAVTRECLYQGIREATAGKRLGDIGAAIQTHAERRGYGVVRDLVGHGVGPTMHEDPLVPHYGAHGKGLRLREGMVLTVEPMINAGGWQIEDVTKTGWGFTTIDHSLSCQYEHQFVITKDGPQILTSQGEEGTY